MKGTPYGKLILSSCISIDIITQRLMPDLDGEKQMFHAAFSGWLNERNNSHFFISFTRDGVLRFHSNSKSNFIAFSVVSKSVTF